MKKIDHIRHAFRELRISGLTTTPSTMELETALYMLEAMIAEWYERNLAVSWQFEEVPDPNADSTAEPWAFQAIALCLAMRLIPTYNIEPSAGLGVAARQSLSLVSNKLARERTRQVAYPRRQPRGHSNLLRNNRWARYYRPVPRVPNTGDSIYLRVGEIRDFTEFYEDWLLAKNNEDLTGYEISTDSGLRLLEHDFTRDTVVFRLEAIDAVEYENNTLQRVKISVRSTDDRIETRFLNVEINPEREPETVDGIGGSGLQPVPPPAP